MNLYLVSRTDYNGEQDEYDSMVVAAYHEEDARGTHPHGDRDIKDWGGEWVPFEDRHTLLKVEFLGTTTKERGVILTSFNAS